MASAADYDDAVVDPADTKDADAVYFPALGVAVVAADGARLQALTAAAAGDGEVVSVEPEYVFHALAPDATPLEHIRGYRDAINNLYDQLTRQAAEPDAADALAAFQDTAELTWGLQATRAATSRFNGQGVKVAVLDTGLDLAHPDFRGRRVVSQTFIPNQQVQDAQGHGTHCGGTGCGPPRPPGCGGTGWRTPPTSSSARC